MIKIISLIITLISLAFATTKIYHNTQQADINYYQGHRLFVTGKIAKAIPFYKKSLSIDSNRLDSLRDLAYCYQWTNQFDRAIDCFRKIIKRNPKNIQIKKDLAQTLAWEKQYKESISIYEEIIKSSNDYEAKIQLAQVLIWDKQLSRAESLLQAILKDKPDSFKSELLLANAMLYSGKAKQAASIYEKLLKDKGVLSRDAIDQSLGLAYSISKQYQAAITKYREILKKNPLDVNTLIELAKVLTWQKDYDQAILEYKKALAIEPNNLDIKEELAQVYSWNKDYDLTEIFCQEIIKKDPQRESSYLLLGKVLSWQARYKQAIDYFKLGLNKDPKNIEIKRCLAQALAWDKQYKESIAIYQDIVKDSNDFDLMFEFAQVLVWDRQFSKAQVLLEEIIRNKPNDFKANLLLADSLFYSGRTKEAASLYKKLSSISKDDINVLLYYVQSLISLGNYSLAKHNLNTILVKEPNNIEAKTFLADIYAYNKNFKAAIAAYKQILEREPRPIVKRKLADVLSWDRQYKQAIELYDQLLKEQFDADTCRQKARVLGWAKDYDQAEREYKKLFQQTSDPIIELEMQAKSAYWDARVEDSINYYRELIKREPLNEEAMFDLSQVYSYQALWKKAMNQYKRILNLSSTHFRAKEGLEKTKLISSHPSIKSGYEFFEADSSSRVDDIKRYSFTNSLVYPINYKFSFNLDYKLTNRLFHDYGDILENEGKLKLIYLNNPSWWADTFYDFVGYNKNISFLNTFGASHSFRFADKNTSRFSYERRRLENTSKVIRERYYSDDFKERLDFDYNRRTKVGLDYLFANYSDGNNRHEPGLDLLYYFSIDPKRLTLKYRYYYKNFLRKVSSYWSPKGFSANALKLNWRHYLNKEEIFFGADDLYYDLAYEATADSTGVVCHKFSVEFNWDINKRLNLNIKGFNTQSSARIYKDRNIIASLNYYF